MQQLIIILGIVFVVYFFAVLILEYVFGFKPTNKDEMIRTLVRQASRWSVAAQQDKSPLIALLHANYGAGYLWGLLDIANESEIKNATGIDVKSFRDKIVSIQDEATKRVSAICPQFAGDVDKTLAQMGGDL